MVTRRLEDGPVIENTSQKVHATRMGSNIITFWGKN